MTVTRIPRTKPFREHYSTKNVDPEITPTLRWLWTDWVILNQDPESAAHVGRWQNRVPGLGESVTPGDVVDYLDTLPPAEQDHVLKALVTLSQQGDQLAGRVLLQAMLPCLLGLAQRTTPPRGIELDEQLQRTLVIFHDVVATLGHQTRVATTLKMETLHRMTEHRRPTARHADVWEKPGLSFQEELYLEPAGTPTGAEGPGDGDGDVYAALLIARRDGVISADDAQFLVELCLAPVLENSITQAALRLGKPRAGVARRFNRLCARLAAAQLATVA